MSAHPYRMMRIADVLAFVGVSRPTLYRWIAAGSFPAPVRLGANSVAWKSTAVSEWLDARAAVPG
ncbi:helix-turn-helix transcriptional regulator [Cupriavidus sp. 2TAF22]|uniref:helix-turn-helix transcriptional regulator n=1 Tax=unclassified Cupriavidus TaxID=2640874 RepID=UPI003F8F5F6D